MESRATYYAAVTVEVELDVEELGPRRLPSPAEDLDHRLVVVYWPSSKLGTWIERETF